jgi:lysozyme family protein
MDGAAILPAAARHVGEKYILGTHAPFNNPNWKGPWDCSEFASWLTYQVYGILYGCGTTSDPDRTAPYTGNWAKDANTRGIKISAEDAAATAGAFLLRLPVDEGSGQLIGHIAISIGDGRVYEAAGHLLGVRIGQVAGRRWDFGICLPGVDYFKGAALTSSTNKALILRRTDPPRFDDHVVELQAALQEKQFDPGRLDGRFGAATENAVAAFQLSEGLVHDGEVGAQTGRALGLGFWPPADDEGPSPTPQAVSITLTASVPHVISDSFGAIVDKATSFSELRQEYLDLFATCIVEDKSGEIAELARRIGANRQRYQDLVASFAGEPAENMPWFFVALIHAMEASGDIGRFRTHLHNGDPLARPTVHVPAGRPNPRGHDFTWEESAKDALSYEHFLSESDWSLARMLYRLEAYNGMGARRRGHASAYLWSYTNHYIKGKYVADNVWRDDAVSKQPGAAAILKQLTNTNVVDWQA